MDSDTMEDQEMRQWASCGLFLFLFLRFLTQGLAIQFELALSSLFSKAGVKFAVILLPQQEI